ncbi:MULTISPECIES: hypothetical protein [Bacillaceae]|uniref:DUF1643 domain-containing protein n=1 Tax=Evansella alkalicola TaxID=745819 RepID=A0ABS6JP64_9BACI|nr:MULTISPECIES: hypothetical protein [Bacillaceae]MBU9720273.1 hypothetical protein [Bacillus alkalicola]
MEYLRKQELMDLFEVDGSFYKIKVGGQIFTCRSVAEVKRKNVSITEYDAIFILTNPGMCEPYFKDYKIPVLDPRLDAIPVTKANSDQTQEQLMRIMLLEEWNSVAIINLSDIKSGNMDVFRRNLKILDNLSYYSHSIFSGDRDEELRNILGKNKGPVIAGWGTNSCIKKLAMEALHHKNIRSLIGLKYHKSPYYYHPKPMLIEVQKSYLRKIQHEIDAYNQKNLQKQNSKEGEKVE